MYMAILKGIVNKIIENQKENQIDDKLNGLL